jgi:nitroimidazol reductase NimA-like FMN-containing flavoprotein (pyridoxamine 5'-phosphate oxidase superfamily)
MRMTGPAPKSADLIAADPTIVLPWEVVRDVLKDTRLYWLATVHPTGRPHVRPVLAVWLDGALYSTSTEASRKGRNLVADPRCTVTARADIMDVVLEGTATQVTSQGTLHMVAEAYRSKYNWPVTVTDGAFDAPYGAPTVGPSPYHPYEITPATVFGFGTADEYAGRTTRYRF